jgi:hypothetical protein
MADGDQKDEKTNEISVLGLLVARKTDILALTAFLIALFGTSFQLYNFARGARIELFHPNTVVIFSDPYPDATFVRVSGPMSYVNSGDGAYAGIVGTEFVVLQVGERQIQLEWQSFGRVERNGDSLRRIIESDARPTVIGGNSSTSHSTAFAPQPVRCGPADRSCQPLRNYMTDAQFLGQLVSSEVLNLTFGATIVGEQTVLRSRCTIEISPSFRASFARDGWFAARCWDTPPSSRGRLTTNRG